MRNAMAMAWWSSLSINEQKDFSKKHLLSYEYDSIWDYGIAKHVSTKKYYELREKIWKSEGEPKINLEVSN